MSEGQPVDRNDHTDSQGPTRGPAKGSVIPSSEKAETETTSEQKTEQEIAELMCNAPPEVRTMIMGMMRSTSVERMPHPFFSKFSSDNISQFLDLDHQQEMARMDIQKSGRWFHLSYVVIFAVFLVFLIVFLVPSHKELLSELIKIFVILMGGVGAGYGLKSREK